MYNAEFPWYPLCPSIHKILTHASAILKRLPPSVASGHLSEEPLEAAQKYLRAYQLDHSRQDSYLHRTQDTFRRMLHHSDPIILSYYLRKRAPQHPPPPQEVLELLIDPEELLHVLPEQLINVVD